MKKIINGSVHESRFFSKYVVVFLGTAGKGEKFHSVWGLLALGGHIDGRRTAPMFQHDKKGRFQFNRRQILRMLSGGKMLNERVEFTRFA